MVRRTGTALLLLAPDPACHLFWGTVLLSHCERVHARRHMGIRPHVSAMQFKPSLPVSIGGVFVILAARFFAPAAAGAALTAAVLIAMTVHLMEYERGRDQAALDFAITIGGIAYLGWVGAYMIDLRALPNGGWWIMLVFPVVWLSDTTAYMIGVRYGAHKMLPRLSPQKSWEGYFAGVVAGTIGGAFLAFAYTRFGPLHVSLWPGALLGPRTRRADHAG